MIIDDDENHATMLSILLERKIGCRVAIRHNGIEGLEYLKNLEKDAWPSLIILDINMPVMNGMEALAILRQKYPAIPVIMLTGNQGTVQAVECMKMGATDYLNKPYEGERLAVTVRNVLKISSLRREVARLSHSRDGEIGFQAIIGHDSGLSSVIAAARKAASADIPVLITGETGTGKEILSRAIHEESTRSGGPFVAVNCGAIPSQLVESTLFGHEKGSFTGAVDKALGKFREAEGGTIFLDEVGELPLETQVKLLRVLQQKEVEPVGGAKAVPVNIRIISATNRNLTKEIQKNTFREDLYYRLNVLELEIPPLRARKQDIPALAEHLAARFCIRQQIPVKPLAVETLERLKEGEWPGNVRQLENLINRAIILSNAETVQPSDLALTGSKEKKEQLTQNNIPCRQNEPDMSINLINTEGKIKSASDIEKEALLKVLQYCEQNVTASAKSLQMAKSTFYRKLAEVSENNPTSGEA